ncbi:hypothetical protein LX36DRAFT_106175 [Colletotrichum falcatum]|nr:hypothetical protein LX36DRAFT_106175 [Colletotrichum falcatum]
MLKSRQGPLKQLETPVLQAAGCRVWCGVVALSRFFFWRPASRISVDLGCKTGGGATLLFNVKMPAPHSSPSGLALSLFSGIFLVDNPLPSTYNPRASRSISVNLLNLHHHHHHHFGPLHIVYRYLRSCTSRGTLNHSRTSAIRPIGEFQKGRFIQPPFHSPTPLYPSFKLCSWIRR